MKTVLAAGIYLTLALGLQAREETAQGFSTPSAAAVTGCSGPNGNIFNLEPRNNAVTQSAMSVAFLPNRVAPNIDLVVATAADGRGASTNPNQTLADADAYYVQRSNSNCAPNFEGGLPAINNVFDLFLRFGSPRGVAAPG